MSPLGCTAVREAAPELALGVLDGAERADVLEHVARCPHCQRYVNDLAGVADGLTRLAPEAEPPFGFARRVDAQIRGPRRRTTRRWMTVAAVAAAAATIVSVTAVRVVDSGSSTPIAAPSLRSVAMVGGDGAWVGRVAVAGASRASLAVTVDYSVPDGTYALRLVDPSGPATQVGSITIAGGRGKWVGAATLPHRAVSLQLVSSTGAVVCHATMPQAAVS